MDFSHREKWRGEEKFNRGDLGGCAGQWQVHFLRARHAFFSSTLGSHLPGFLFIFSELFSTCLLKCFISDNRIASMDYNFLK